MVLSLTQSHSALSFALFCYTRSETAGRNLQSMLPGHHLRQLVREGAMFSLGPILPNGPYHHNTSVPFFFF